MLKYTRAQAALEFLTTYGWAFLVIMIAIGSLSYFGVLNPGKLLPERCNMPPEFICVDHYLDGQTQNTTLRLRHNVGKTIQLINITCQYDDETSVTFPAVPPYGSWGPKESVNMECLGASGLISNQKGKVSVTITYRTDPTGYIHFGEGEVYANVR